LQYAMDGYGIKSGKAHLEVFAQSGSSVGGSSTKNPDLTGCLQHVEWDGQMYPPANCPITYSNYWCEANKGYLDWCLCGSKSFDCKGLLGDYTRVFSYCNQ